MNFDDATIIPETLIANYGKTMLITQLLMVDYYEGMIVQMLIENHAESTTTQILIVNDNGTTIIKTLIAKHHAIK